MLSELKIAQLRNFVWVAELKSFHAAAQQAHRTQPAISMSIRDLEDKLGEALFEKHEKKGSKTRLTPFGQLIMYKAKELIVHHDRVAEDMRLLVEHKAGHIRLAAVPSIASRVLPDLLQCFLDNSPGLHLSFFDDNSAGVLKMVETQKVDFGIASLFSEQDYQDKSFIPIWEDRIGLVCPYDHPLAQKESVHWRELRQERLITNGTARLLEGTEAAPLLSKSHIYMSNMISLIAMLEAGFGVTTLPWYAFPVDNKKLRFVPLSVPDIKRKVGIVRIRNRSLSPAAEALLEFIVEQSAG